MMKKRIVASVVVLALIICLLPVVSKATDELKNPRIFDNYGNESVVTWDCVYFGNYWQKDSDGNVDKTSEKKPIKWRVLSVDNDDLFLLADENICKINYYNTSIEGGTVYTWRDSLVRNWIQTDFEKNAFTEKESIDIVETNTTLDNISTTDKVYLLSEKELERKYGFIDFGNRSPVDCILRTNTTNVHGVLGTYATNGDIGTVDVFSKCYIRPALHLKKSSTHYKKAGTVNIYNELNVERTPKPLPTRIPTQTPTPTPQTPKKIVKKVTAPSKPTKLKAKNNKKKTVTVTWHKVSDTYKYQVQYAYSAPFSKKTKTVASNKLVVKKLKKKKTYSFRVRAYKMDGKRKVYGKWSKVVRVKIKK